MTRICSAVSGESTFVRSVTRFSTFWVLLQIVALIRLDVRDAAARADRHVALVVVLERARDRVRRRGQRGVDVALRRAFSVADDLPLGVHVAVVLPEVAGARKDRVGVPHDLQLRRSLDRVELLRRHDAEEVVHLHDLRARDVGDRLRVDAHRDVRVVRVRALAARPHHAAVQHPGHADLVHVGVLAGHLVRDVDADDRVRVLERPSCRPTIGFAGATPGCSVDVRAGER